MADQVKKYTLELFGEPHTIITDEPVGDITQAADYFNQCMEILSSESGLKDAKKLAFLTGLQLSQELLRMQKQLVSCETNELKAQSLVEEIEASFE
ncbi:MAG TPA: cell division protein ZapA [Candidatus Babeliales bacterium]|nr:cell division protein ZapA [Candidatus Babeliales bacterium]